MTLDEAIEILASSITSASSDRSTVRDPLVAARYLAEALSDVELLAALPRVGELVAWLREHAMPLIADETSWEDLERWQELSPSWRLVIGDFR